MIDFIEKKPAAEEYNSLTEAVGGGREPDHLIEEMLENTLYSVCAYDGETGLNLAKEIIPDLMILDVIMPKINGYKISRLLKYDNKYKKSFTGE